MFKELKFIIATHTDCLELAIFNKSLVDNGGSNNNMTIKELEVRMHEFISSGYLAIIFSVEDQHIGYTLIDNSKSPIFIRHFFYCRAI
ncbi:hypothetical protein HMPREF9449_00519 [Odoribacter laneus YIT 12061]|uniref:N-acetyltransferase domain-containing protein n=1 Tax=Odoribacter laneus YIT 12061 TaxID=742817 RepID=H1DE33_9BACT|nr:hypothetical protein HMPREF9449_00519 [Odoribacter laneus YIT 12061]